MCTGRCLKRKQEVFEEKGGQRHDPDRIELLNSWSFRADVVNNTFDQSYQARLSLLQLRQYHTHD